jgi:ribonuclease D
MGLCLYSPNLKQVYVPINHRDKDTKERLSNQLNEEEVRIELSRIKEAKTYVLMHNGKFDYQVIKCTCGIEIEPNWDTLIAAKLLNENENHSLKYQYHLYVDNMLCKSPGKD